MTTIPHSTLTANHIPYNWTYANTAARLAASGFVSGDVGKLAKQTDSGGLWMLTATTPQWTLVSDGYTPPIASQFSVGNNPTGGTYTDTSTGLSVYAPNQSGTILQALVDAQVPGGTFTITSGFNITAGTGNSSSGVWIGDNSGKLVAFGIDPASGKSANINYWTNYTSFSSNSVNITGSSTSNFLKITYNGTTFVLSTGCDLNALLVQNTQSATAFIGAPTKIGLFQLADNQDIFTTYFHYKYS